MTELKNHYVSDLWEAGASGNTGPDRETAFYDSLKAGAAGYFWADIDYADKLISAWKCAAHLSRLGAVITRSGEKRLDGDAEYRAKILGALDYWLENDFTNPNWWHNQIGVPAVLADICLLAEKHIGGKRREKAQEILGRGSVRGNKAILTWTGANLLWGVWGTVRDALFLGDESLLRRAVLRASDELTEAKGSAEGIKEDRSFWQHGALLYSGGYGRAFTGSVAGLAYLFGGSEFQFSKDKLQLFCEHVLFGQRYFNRRGTMDYLCVGRELARRNALSAASLRSSVIRMLKTPEMPRKDDLCAYLAELEGGTGLCDTRWFRSSCVLCHHRPHFYMSVKGSRSDLIGTECGNFENYLGYNLSFGGNACFMADGREYVNIAPVWDYSMLPGTTSLREDDAALLARTGAYDRWYSRKGTNSYCGGASDGRRGVLYMKLEHDGLSGLLSYFFFDFGMVALGADITHTVPDTGEAPEVVTTVNQCFFTGTGGLSGETVQTGPERISNGCFSYFNLCGTPLTVSAGPVTGSWKRNNAAESDEPVKRSVFKLWYSHGRRPVSSSYACAVCGGAEAENPPVARIVNTASLQAVELEDGTAVAVFHRPGGYTTVRGGTMDSAGGICFI